MVENNKAGGDDKIWAAVSYLWILSLVALAARKNNEYVRFHANQGFLLFVASLIFMVLGPIGWILNVVVAIAVIMGIVKALSGEKWELPGLGGFAKKIGDWMIKTLKI